MVGPSEKCAHCQRSSYCEFRLDNTADVSNENLMLSAHIMLMFFYLNRLKKDKSDPNTLGSFLSICMLFIGD